ncbi:MAG TPA: serine hydrolase domain-containing protein [Actinopolymorphaceae bacterium]
MSAAPLVAGAAWGGASAADAESGGSAHLPRELGLGGTLDRFVAKLAERDEFSGTLLVKRRGRTALQRAYGMADKAREIPNTPDTIFILGSITKLFTAVAIAQLAQQGTVAYDANVGRYLDGLPAKIADTVTIHQLLTHTSGLGDYHSKEYFEAAAEWDSARDVWEGTWEFVRRSELLFTPGSRQTYSNTGYVLLGAIVAELSKEKSYYEYVRSHVFEAARTKVTDFYTRPEWRANPRIALPYEKRPSGERVEVVDRHGWIGLPPGGAFADASDLAAFADALMGHRLLRPEYTHLTVTPKLPIPIGDGPGESPDVLGLPFATYAPLAELIDRQWVLGHSGGSPGVSANLTWFPDSGWVAVILSNYGERATAPINRLVRRLVTDR